MDSLAMNFAERLMSDTVETVKRKRPVVGDVVVSHGGRAYLVEEVLTDGYGQWYAAGVKSLSSGLPNAFSKGEFVILTKREGKDAVAYYEETRDL